MVKSLQITTLTYDTMQLGGLSDPAVFPVHEGKTLRYSGIALLCRCCIVLLYTCHRTRMAAQLLTRLYLQS